MVPALAVTAWEILEQKTCHCGHIVSRLVPARHCACLPALGTLQWRRHSWRMQPPRARNGSATAILSPVEREAVMARSDPLPLAHPTGRIVGNAPAIQSLRAQIRHLVTFDTVGSAFVPTLLLQGETGTGKGLVARVIHDSGPRAHGQFVDVNCAAIPETLLEVELFGFEAGTFTDARHAKPGLMESASRGTLFLDEIDALPLLLQAKLLSAIEEKRVRRLGAVGSRQIDGKCIAATT